MLLVLLGGRKSLDMNGVSVTPKVVGQKKRERSGTEAELRDEVRCGPAKGSVLGSKRIVIANEMTRARFGKILLLLFGLIIERPLHGEGFRQCGTLCYFDHGNRGDVKFVQSFMQYEKPPL